MKVERKKLKQLMKDKLHKAGLSDEHADIIAEILTWSDERGYHSHGAVRVEYYAERIFKGGINTNPKFSFEKTGPASGIYSGDNGCGYVAATFSMEEAIKMAKETGVAVVGVKNISHSGSIGYYVEMATKEDLVAISMCQSDPMAVPYGGSEPYYGTNPIAFGVPTADDRAVIFDMATTVQAWGKILVARSKKEPIPDTWAVDEDGNPTTDSTKVNALVPIAGPKGYGLMMMVDVLSGVLLGLPFGKHVSSMYEDLSKGRDLGQLHIVIDPSRFTDIESFKKNMSTVLDELGEIKPAEGFDRVNYPGERALIRKEKYDKEGVEIVDDIYNYLIGDAIHFDNYDHKNKFAE
ncbi:ureidoglycolate dehydrogenase [Clostridium argentinense CDC 2741]|uniref:Ureidoglycolate dehydrogenase n=1 Tax=Clostridium argentinense CDC 2741 TaxID=1418104 RepID=A0A0C1U0J8_9CLOT|nr:ureidoglycolate dehydrogenase [Clostridium argentinense]ARC86087.1 ureidoglycolate dehydrogenase [Clostridium argentinense]KIE46334.1 ureidoglycolate dehydrogenase [Clostridium argentinense CDC 2741]NFF39028.1 ureidoglycolate dehydrogenase [Clostridium argentinense]NFP48820.1 ureidoglycolate dehydrogenase [Clostridium argentinense]NFP70912.1 ureidoglycolate dehydrogenase [Clostridium argentinense]